MSRQTRSKTEDSFGGGEDFSGCQLPTSYLPSRSIVCQDLKAENGIEMLGRHVTTRDVAKEVGSKNEI